MALDDVGLKYTGLSGATRVCLHLLVRWPALFEVIPRNITPAGRVTGYTLGLLPQG